MTARVMADKIQLCNHRIIILNSIIHYIILLYVDLTNPQILNGSVQKPKPTSQ